MQPQPKTYITPEEYLTLERAAGYRSEYFDGEMFAMAGASEPHNTIVSNVTFLLVGQFKGRDCKSYANDMRVRIPKTGLYTYPDIIVVCGKAEFEDEEQDTLLNPMVIIEVLSKSTEAYDRGRKFEHYRTIPSLSDYLLIAQDTPKIEHFVRQTNRFWLLSESQGPEDTIKIVSIGCRLLLTEVYDKVEWEQSSGDLEEKRR